MEKDSLYIRAYITATVLRIDVGTYMCKQRNYMLLSFSEHNYISLSKQLFFSEI